MINGRTEGPAVRWLTREWASGELDDDEWDARWEQYASHCADVRSRLSKDAELLLDVNLHDAQHRSFEYSPHETLTVRALMGDLIVGYEFVELTYMDAELRVSEVGSVRALRLLHDRTEILYTEVDAEADGRFVHRVLLWPRGEYEVVFTAVKVHREPASPGDRR